MLESQLLTGTMLTLQPLTQTNRVSACCVRPTRYQREGVSPMLHEGTSVMTDQATGDAGGVQHIP